jgi:hypothetical protein
VKRGLTWVALVALVGCATSGSDAQKPSSARVVVTTMTPVAASVVGPSSVIEATVVFTIDQFSPNGNTYYVLIECEDTSGGGVDRKQRLTDLPILTAPQGSVVLTYPLAQAWGNPKLRKPVRVWVDVIERMGPNDAVVIGRSGPVEYAVK